MTGPTGVEAVVIYGVIGTPFLVMVWALVSLWRDR